MLVFLFLGSLTSICLAQDEPRDVVGGTAVSAGDWEDTAAIMWWGSTGCTGVLIAPDVVMTAGHCIGGISHVKLATNDYTHGGETIEVTREYEYPNSWSTVDVGVLVLERESSVEPRVIAQDCIMDDLFDGAPVQIVGYGATDIWGYQYGTQLREARTVVTDHDCTSTHRGCNGSVSPGGEIGAGGEGVDACFGDSGGPLYLVTAKGDFLVGITSRAWSDAWAPCEEGGIYGRPDSVIEWIEDVTGRTLPEPDCDGGGSGGDDDPPDDGGSDGGGGNGGGGDGGDGTGSGDNAYPEPPDVRMRVVQGGMTDARVRPNDPDPEDSHTFIIVEPPDYGDAEVDADGWVTYYADSDYQGMDEFVVLVTDDGEPARSTGATVMVSVITRDDGEMVEAEVKGCGCSHTHRRNGGWAAMVLMLLGVLATRRPR